METQCTMQSPLVSRMLLASLARGWFLRGRALGDNLPLETSLLVSPGTPERSSLE